MIDLSGGQLVTLTATTPCQTIVTPAGQIAVLFPYSATEVLVAFFAPDDAPSPHEVQSLSYQPGAVQYQAFGMVFDCANLPSPLPSAIPNATQVEVAAVGGGSPVCLVPGTTLAQWQAANPAADTGITLLWLDPATTQASSDELVRVCFVRTADNVSVPGFLRITDGDVVGAAWELLDGTVIVAPGYSLDADCC